MHKAAQHCLTQPCAGLSQCDPQMAASIFGRRLATALGATSAAVAVAGAVGTCASHSKAEGAALPALYARKWSPVAAGTPMSGSTITVCQFNVLADGLAGLARKPSFTECPLTALEWSYRGSRIIEEITRHGQLPDVVALQEVDHFEEWLPVMRKLGYDGVFEPKPNSPCKRSLNPDLEDGCALFWRTERLALSQLHRLNYDGVGKHEGKKSNQVALVADLHLAGDNGGALVVGVTHLMASKNASGEVGRQSQLLQLLDYVHAHVQDGQPFVLAMDMNAAPQRNSGSDYEPLAYPAALAHPLLLRSAYADVLGAEPPYTTWKVRGPHEAKQCIDYIFHSPGMRVRRVLLPPEEADVGPGRLPCFEYPSDHVMLCAEVMLPPPP